MSRINPSMNDCRCFTSYLPSCQVDEELARAYGVHDQTSLRFALQRNMAVADAQMRKLNVCNRVTPKAWYAKTR